MQHDDDYEAPAVEDRTEVEEPLSLIASSDQTDTTPVWRKRDS
jgi:hypothetical protein